MKFYKGKSSETEYLIKDIISDDATGTEGSILEVSGSSGLVAKIYHKWYLELEGKELEEKLEYMVGIKIDEKQRDYIIAWPKEIIRDYIEGNWVFVGYTMREVPSMYNIRDIIDLMQNDPDDMDLEYKKIYKSWEDCIKIAYNLSSIVKYLHEKGIEVGDFNESNILYDEYRGGFSLVDCGTYGVFDVNTHNSIFPCKLGSPSYSTREQIIYKRTIDPPQSDCFYLAVLIFRLLMQGTDPFGSDENSDGEPEEQLFKSIANGECLFVRDIPGKNIDKTAIKPGILPDDILEAFNRTFNYTKETVRECIEHRTTAEEWCDILKPYVKRENMIKQCPVKAGHSFPAHLSECPWCNPESVSSLSYEKRIKEGKTIGYQKPEERKAKPSPKSDSEYKTIADIAAEVRAEAKKINETLDMPKRRNHDTYEDYEVVHIGEPKDYDESKFRAALARLKTHEFITHNTYGEGEVVENFDPMIIKVLFGNDVKVLSKDALVYQRKLKIYSYTEQEYQISRKHKDSILNTSDKKKQITSRKRSGINDTETVQESNIVNNIQQEGQYDIFLCYKESDDNGSRTSDYMLARDMYHKLKQDGFKVFLPRIYINVKSGTKTVEEKILYHPFPEEILNSAKIMIVLGTRQEYFNSAVVKKEWSKFLSIKKQGGRERVIIPAYKDMNPKELPEELSHFCALDMSKPDFMQNLIRSVKKSMESDTTNTK